MGKCRHLTLIVILRVSGESIPFVIPDLIGNPCLLSHYWMLHCIQHDKSGLSLRGIIVTKQSQIARIMSAVCFSTS